MNAGPGLRAGIPARSRQRPSPVPADAAPVKQHLRRRCRQAARSGFGFGLRWAGPGMGLVALTVMIIPWMSVIAAVADAQKLPPVTAAIDVPLALAIIRARHPGPHCALAGSRAHPAGVRPHSRRGSARPSRQEHDKNREKDNDESPDRNT